jgi:hypothetical protein
MNALGLKSVRAMGICLAATVAIFSGCQPQASPEPVATRPAVSASTSVGTVAAPLPAPANVVARASSVTPPSAAPSATTPSLKSATGALSVKRFVVGSGVKDREPLSRDEPLISDGSAIYAFAELANPHGDSENVRVTFERKGGVERVGDVTLPVPANVGRHRTWAFTRFIRSAGVWEAVLWSESGVELARTSFEVKPA